MSPAAGRREARSTATAPPSDQPPTTIPSDWWEEVRREFDLVPKTAHESFFNVDGEPLVERLAGLAELAIRTNRPILFQ